MEKFGHQEYRDKLAKDLKSIEDHTERKEALESEQDSFRYKLAEERHLVDVAAHPEKVRKTRIEELKQEGEMIDFLRDAIEKEENTRDKDKPFPEDESYYANSSHSAWNESFAGLKWLPKEKAEILADLAQRDEKWAKVVAELDKYTLTGYVTSATQDEIEFEKNPDKWFHLPYGGAMVTFYEIMENDSRAFSGHGIKDGSEVSNDPRIAKIIPDLEKASDLIHKAKKPVERSGEPIQYEPHKRTEAIALLGAIHAKLQGINSSLLSGVDGLITALEKSIKEEDKKLQK